MRVRALFAAVCATVLAAVPSLASAQAPVEQDLAVVNLPTTLTLASHRSAFRLTHRFQNNLEQGSLGEQTSRLFGLDSGA